MEGAYRSRPSPRSSSPRPGSPWSGHLRKYRENPARFGRARGAQGTPGAWRARAAPGSTERVTTERVCGKEGHDCEWQCGKVLILCLSLKSSLWRGSGVYQPPSATKHPGRRGRRCRHASAYAGQGAGHMGAGDVSCGGWGGGRVTCAASMPPSPTPPRGRISSTSERSEPQI